MAAPVDTTGAMPSHEGSSEGEVVAEAFMSTLSSQEEATRVAHELAVADLPDFGSSPEPVASLARWGHGVPRGMSRRIVP